jgi:hypothetical protein
VTKPDLASGILASLAGEGPTLFDYSLRDRDGRSPPMLARGVLELAAWRSSMVFPYFAIAGEREDEWKGEPSATRDLSAAEPSPLLRPLWLLWCLFGARNLEESTANEAGTSAWEVECDLVESHATTGLNFMRSPESTKQLLRVAVTEPGRRRLTVEGEAHLGRASIRFLPESLDTEKIDWSRIGALSHARW